MFDFYLSRFLKIFDKLEIGHSIFKFQISSFLFKKFMKSMEIVNLIYFRYVKGKYRFGSGNIYRIDSEAYLSKVGCVFPIIVDSSMRNSGQITIGRTRPTLKICALDLSSENKVFFDR